MGHGSFPQAALTSARVAASSERRPRRSRQAILTGVNQRVLAAKRTEARTAEVLLFFTRAKIQENAGNGVNLDWERLLCRDRLVGEEGWKAQVDTSVRKQFHRDYDRIVFSDAFAVSRPKPRSTHWPKMIKSGID